MKEIKFTVETFVNFLNQNISNPKLKNLMVIVDYFYGAQGGCSCSRDKRTQAMKDIFNNKILNLDLSTVEEIKKITNSTEIIFYKDIDIVLKQF